MSEPTIKSNRLTEGTIIYLGSVSLAIAVICSLIQSNQAISMSLCLGYVLFAQQVISAFFEGKSDDDKIKRRIVMVLMIGYIAIFGVLLWRWNDLVSGSVTTGYLFFIQKLGKSYFGITDGNSTK